MFKFEKLALFFLAFQVAFLSGMFGLGCDGEDPQCTGTQCNDAGSDGTPVQTDGGTDSDGTPVQTDGGDGGGDVCAAYEPLDGWEQGWSCSKGSVDMACTFSLDPVSGACYLLCHDDQVGDSFRCPPPASFSHSASWKSFTCTSLSGSQVSCSR
jgi:hypothetical protein